jgi:CHAD domain-containing protein
LAAQSLRKQVKLLAEHLRGVRLDKDIESVHRARVASRRLRAALGMFRACWKRKQVKTWTAQIRDLARHLGEARDQDVLIEYLTSSLAGVSDRVLVPGIASLLSHAECQRQWIQPGVLKAVDRLETQDLLKAMQEAVRETLAEAGHAPLVAGKRFRGQVAKSVRKRLAKLLDEAPGLADPERCERHHAMRIAAKWLRYTLELARPVCSADVAPIGDAVKRLQTLLGEIHDCDVWIGNFADFAHKAAGEVQIYFGSSQRFERLRPGLDYLRQEREDRRRQVFAELVGLWQELQDRQVWDRLASIVECDGAREKAQAESGDSSPVEILPQA